MTAEKIIIGIATFKRPEGLITLLTSIQEDSSAAARPIVVVDNDQQGSARAVVDKFANLKITYLTESVPGIAAVRNRVLDHALAEQADALVFVDDDEFVGRGWMEQLVGAQVQWNADVVCGPVVPVLPDETPSWVREGRFFDRPSGTSGGEVRWPATNNVLIRLNAPGIAEGTRFEEEFSMTGGSDTDFFYHLRECGAKFVWCEEAMVWETVPTSRARLSWLWQRGKRLGNVSARMMTRQHSRPYVASIAIARIAAAVPLVILSLVTQRHPIGHAAMHLPKGIGMLQALNGDLVVEYKRSSR